MIHDIRQVISFVEALPPLETGYCYLLALVQIDRVRGDHYVDLSLATEREVIPWYQPVWREAYIRRVRKLAILGENAEKIYRVIGSTLVFSAPSTSMGIIASINPSNMVKALARLIYDSMDMVFAGAEPEPLARVEERWFSSLHRYSRKLLHTIGTGSIDLLSEVLRELIKYTKPHIVIKGAGWYRIIVHIKSLGGKKEQYFKEFVSGWMENASKEYVDRKGRPLVWYADNGLEPVPGTVYGGSEVKIVEWEALL
ncbi:MAG: hypothetical protein DRO39_00860 [Thermoprotei archaeon]|nr:MAG: hypothetical protein DRO39_00860 [Thermoprotei archaeon]